MSMSEKLQKMQERKREVLVSSWQAVLDTKTGRRVIWNILQLLNYGFNPFDPASERQTAYNLGKQEAAQRIVQTIKETRASALRQMENDANAAAEQEQKELKQIQEQEVLYG